MKNEKLKRMKAKPHHRHPLQIIWPDMCGYNSTIKLRRRYRKCLYDGRNKK